MDRQFQSGEDSNVKVASTSTEARLQRKRQVNRLSAQRKRIREKNMMKILSEKCNELVANRKVLETEREKLISFLSVVKAKVDTSNDDTNAAALSTNISATDTAPANRTVVDTSSKTDNSDSKASDSLDFIAKGLLELANSGTVTAKTEQNSMQPPAPLEKPSAPREFSGERDNCTSRTETKSLSPLVLSSSKASNATRKLPEANKEDTDKVAADRRPAKKRKVGIHSPSNSHSNPSSEWKAGTSSFSGSSLSSESEQDAPQDNTRPTTDSNSNVAHASSSMNGIPTMNGHTFDSVTAQAAKATNAGSIFEHFNSARSSYFSNLSRASDDIRTPMANGFPSLINHHTGQNPFLNAVQQPSPFAVTAAAAPFPAMCATAAQKTPLNTLSGLTNPVVGNASANQQVPTPNENQFQLALALILGQVAQQLAPPLTSTPAASRPHQQPMMNPLFSFPGQLAPSTDSIKQDEINTVTTGSSVRQPITASVSPSPPNLSQNPFLESMLTTLGSVMTAATRAPVEQQHSTTANNLVSPTNSINNDEQQKQAALQLLSALIMQQAATSLGTGRV